MRRFMKCTALLLVTGLAAGAYLTMRAERAAAANQNCPGLLNAHQNALGCCSLDPQEPGYQGKQNACDRIELNALEQGCADITCATPASFAAGCKTCDGDLDCYEAMAEWWAESAPSNSGPGSCTQTACPTYEQCCGCTSEGCPAPGMGDFSQCDGGPY